jgi:HlyD family secretion protein
MADRPKRSIFRKVALERLSSPEQLDQLMAVTRPQGWLALSAVGLLLLAAGVWSVYGSIPTVAAGEGILLRQEGVSDLVAAADGQVERILVDVGDSVERGDVVARIRQDELLRRIRDEESRLAALDEEYRELTRYAAEQRRLHAGNLEQKRANLEHGIGTLERDLELLEEKVAVERDLLAEGLVTKQTLLDTQQELNAKRDELAGLRLELNGLELTRLESEQELDQLLETQRSRVRDLRLELGDLRARLEENARVISPYSGRVVELAVNAGDVVAPGTPVLSLELLAEDLVAMLFVPAEAGKKIASGMEAQVSPSIVRREEYGYILGSVVWVAEFPSTARGMMRLLANESLVDDLMSRGPLIRVDVELRRDPSTPTGYGWSSSTGPDLRITSGTLASGSVIVRESRPIEMVIPKIRENLGV